MGLIKRKQLELETERLLLCPFTEKDGPIMYALNDDPEVLQYTGDLQFASIDAAKDFMANYDQYEKYAVGRMSVIIKKTGEIVGWCGLKYHPKIDEYDIGYRFFKKAWSKGYATESALACIDYGLNMLNISRIVGRARKENTASIKVLEKLGMYYLKDFVEDGKDWVLYEVNKENVLSK